MEKKNSSKFLPKNDGIDHINVYSQAGTTLGKMLSNFYRFPIETPDGRFMSVEGYWYWMSIEPCEEREALRDSSGVNAKNLGREILKTKAPAWDNNFENKILSAIWYKFKRNAHLLRPEYAHLPIRHYYNYKGFVVDVTEKYDWMIQGISQMRDLLIEHLYPTEQKESDDNEEREP